MEGRGPALNGNDGAKSTVNSDGDATKGGAQPPLSTVVVVSKPTPAPVALEQTSILVAPVAAVRPVAGADKPAALPANLARLFVRQRLSGASANRGSNNVPSVVDRAGYGDGSPVGVSDFDDRSGRGEGSGVFGIGHTPMVMPGFESDDGSGNFDRRRTPEADLRRSHHLKSRSRPLHNRFAAGGSGGRDDGSSESSSPRRLSAFGTQAGSPRGAVSLRAQSSNRVNAVANQAKQSVENVIAQLAQRKTAVEVCLGALSAARNNRLTNQQPALQFAQMIRELTDLINLDEIGKIAALRARVAALDPGQAKITAELRLYIDEKESEINAAKAELLRRERAIDNDLEGRKIAWEETKRDLLALDGLYLSAFGIDNIADWSEIRLASTQGTLDQWLAERERIIQAYKDKIAAAERVKVAVTGAAELSRIGQADAAAAQEENAGTTMTEHLQAEITAGDVVSIEKLRRDQALNDEFTKLAATKKTELDMRQAASDALKTTRDAALEQFVSDHGLIKLMISNLKAALAEIVTVKKEIVQKQAALAQAAAQDQATIWQNVQALMSQLNISLIQYNEQKSILAHNLALTISEERY